MLSSFLAREIFARFGITTLRFVQFVLQLGLSDDYLLLACDLSLAQVEVYVAGLQGANASMICRALARRQISLRPCYGGSSCYLSNRPFICITTTEFCHVFEVMRDGPFYVARISFFDLVLRPRD